MTVEQTANPQELVLKEATPLIASRLENLQEIMKDHHKSLYDLISQNEISFKEQEIPSYYLCQKLTTVMEVWKEYHEGFGTAPSVKMLEEKFGAKWRKNVHGTKVFF